VDAIKVGDAEIRRVEEIVHKMPLSQIVDDKDFIAQHLHWLAPRFLDNDGNYDMVWQSWIVLVDGKVIVIDPCSGNGRANPAFPMAHMLDTPYIERFAATGFKPEDVDYVFCTHLHFDHCGWNTRLRGGRYVPTFPNARYIFTRREYEHWDPQRPGHTPVEAMKGVFETSVLPVVEAGLAHIVGERHRLCPSLAIEPAHGHTAGHAMAHLVSKAVEACFVGDAFHHPLELLRPEADAHVDEDAPTAMATRRRIVDLCLEHDALIIPAHFPNPHAGWVRRHQDEVMFEPLSA
jgi:glyoxylase-like metal-dependent hydrolase (beta-lactamase superfamily II)